MDDWETLKECQESLEAQAEVEFLEQNGVPARIAINQPIPGLINGVKILVPKPLLHRAKWVMAQQQCFSDEELSALATEASTSGVPIEN